MFNIIRNIFCDGIVEKNFLLTKVNFVKISARFLHSSAFLQPSRFSHNREFWNWISY